jgi:hypothetical protein
MIFSSIVRRGQSISSTSASSSTSFGRTCYTLSARSARSGRLRWPTWATSSLKRGSPWMRTRLRRSLLGRSLTPPEVFADSWGSQDTTGSSSATSASSRRHSPASCPATPSPVIRRQRTRSRRLSTPSRQDPFYRCRTSTSSSSSTATRSVSGSVLCSTRAPDPSHSSAACSPLDI